MPATYVTDAFAAFTADGDAQGYATVADNAAFYPGATAWLINDDGTSLECVITDLVGTTKIGVRAKPGMLGASTSTGPNYGRTPITAFTTAKHSKICQEAGVVPLEAPSSVVKKDIAY